MSGSAQDFLGDGPPILADLDSLSREDVLATAEPLIGAGVAVHWLRPRSKAPYDNDGRVALFTRSARCAPSTADATTSASLRGTLED